MLKVLVLVSGGGTNLQAIIDGVEGGTIPDTRIVGVISSSPSAYALERAAKHGIPGKVVSAKDYDTREEFHRALEEEIERESPDLIVLAGFLVVLPESIVKKYERRILNVHPSLIPSFCGKGFYGLKVHEEALKRGVKVTGATVHFVDEGTDTGPILFQKAVQVLPGDTPEALQKRVMQEAEWVLLPLAIAKIAEGEIPLGKCISDS